MPVAGRDIGTNPSSGSENPEPGVVSVADREGGDRELAAALQRRFSRARRWRGTGAEIRGASERPFVVSPECFAAEQLAFVQFP